MQSQPINSQKQSTGEIVTLVFKALAVATAVAAVVLNVLNVATAQTQLLLLGVGLFCLAVTAFETE